MAKTALVTGGAGGMGRVIASRLAADGFDVAVAYTGETDLADAAVSETKERGRQGAAIAADIAGEHEAAVLFRAVGRPENIAGVVSFLVGPTGRWVNRQVVYANGGFI